jgi:hypothetical protein
MATFRTTILSSGKTAAGIRIPDEVVEGFGAGRKPAVRVTIGAHTYRSTVARRGDSYLVGVSAENRALAEVAAGDEVDVALELDTEPREVALPADLAVALASAGAREAFDGSSYTVRKEIVRGVEEAKKPETRQRRIEKAVAGLNA